MEPFEIMVSESQERMLCVVEPDAGRRGARGLREVGGQRDGDRRGHRRRAGCGCSTATRWSATCRSPRWSTSARSTTSSRCRRATPLYPAPPRALADGPTRARRCSRCSRSANLASRRWAFEQYDCLVGSRTVRRPEQADAAVLVLDEPRRRPGPRIAVSIDGNGRRVACDPYRGAVEAVARVRGQPRLRRRRAARADQLPELRQPGEAAHRLAAHARGRRARRRLPRARRAGRRRQRLALQRGRRGADLPHAGRRHGRRAARRARAGRLGFAAGRATRRADRAPAPGRRPRPAPSWPSCAARRSGASCRPPTSASCARCTPPCARPSARARCAPPTTWPRAASPSRWPSAASPAGPARRSTSRRCGRPASRAVRRGPGRLRGLRAASAAARVRRAPRSSATSAATLSPSPARSVPVAELSEAHAGGLADLL